MIKLEIKNIDKIIDKFGRMPGKARKELHNAVIQSAFQVEREAKPITPFDTGLLKGSIRKDIMPMSALIAPHVHYAIYVHEGTRKWPLRVPPRKPGTVRQFMKIGAERALPKIQKFFDEAIKKVIS